jgi:IS5 family transposase
VRLLQALDHSKAPAGLQVLPAVRALRAVWAQQFALPAEDSGSPSPNPDTSPNASDPVPPKQARRRGRGKTDRLVSPYDTDARFRSRKGRDWSGYMVHFTETCDADRPRLVIHADTTPANVHDMARLAPIHAALADKGLLPREHFVDAGYVSAGHLVQAAKRHGIALVGPGRKDVSWQRRTPGAFQATDFTVAWEERRVRCPEGRESVQWGEFENAARGRYVKVRFKAEECLACGSRVRCTRSAGAEKGRQLLLQPRDRQEALAAARTRQHTEAGRRLYALRQGIEATFSQGVRAFGLRRARYRGLAKTRLQHVATAAALNLDRAAAWMRGRPVAPTRTSRFTALAA